MMLTNSQYQTCPRCQMQISEATLSDGLVACNHCSWTPTPDAAEDSKQALMGIVAFASLFIVSLIHVTNWDSHSISIIPLKTRQLIGMTSASDSRELAKICSELMKHECEENALSDISSTEFSADDSLRLGNLRRKLGKNSEAILAYNKALTITNLDSSTLADIQYGLAKCYENIRETDKAIFHYESSLAAKPEVIQITVTEAYIKLLKQLGQSQSIEKVIAEARKRGGSERLFAAAL